MLMYLLFFFFNDTATTEIYTLSLHDALPILFPVMSAERGAEATHIFQGSLLLVSGVYYPIEVLPGWLRSEEHTSELQSLAYLVCRLLLEKKKNKDMKKILNVLYKIHCSDRLL